MFERSAFQRFIVCLSAIVFISSLGQSCITVEPEVGEYKYFEAYDGFLPIGERGFSVRADLVVPSPLSDGELDYRLPSSIEEAMRRVKEHSTSQLHPGFEIPLIIIVIVPAMVLVPIGLLAIHIFESDSYDLYEEMMREFELFGGIEVEISVNNQGGEPVDGAQIVEVPSSLLFPVYLNERGRRSFAAPRSICYDIPQSVLELMVDHLPVSVGRTEVELKFNDRTTIKTVGGTIGENPWSSHYCDETGKSTIVSRAASRFARLDEDDDWEWTCSPVPITLNFIVWAAGYHPEVIFVKALPGEKHSARAALTERPNGSRERVAVRKLGDALKSADESVSRGWFTKGNLDREMARAVLASLEEIASDTTLPGCIRWNARGMIEGYIELVRQLRGHTSIFREAEYKSVVKHAERMLEKLGSEMDGCSPFLGDSIRNPWSWAADMSSWVGHGRLGGHQVLTYSDFAVGSEWNTLDREEMYDEARDLLRRAKLIDPNHPLLSNLEAVIAHTEGRHDEVLAYTKHMDHRSYFEIFHNLLVLCGVRDDLSDN